MKNKYALFVSFLLVTMSMQTHAQRIPLGNVADLLQDVKVQSQTSAGRTAPHIQLKVPAAVLEGKINHRTGGTGSEYIIGEIEAVPGSSFFIRIEANILEGNIILRESKKAYRYYSDSQGNAYVEEADIDKLICIDYEQGPGRSSANQRTSAMAAISPELLTLESFPGGNGCVLLDFDGEYVSGTPWNNGNPIDAAPAVLTDAQILQVWELVSEDYRPFHLNITTNEAVFNSYPQNRRMRCIFTPTNTAAPGYGGVAYVGSFRWSDNTPCWVFNSSVKGAGEAGSHEVGHTFGLGHDGRTSPEEGYYQGHGDWAPIMGVGYYVPIVQWSKGEYANPSNTEDDLAKIAGSTYGVGYRADDHGATMATASALAIDGSGMATGSGVIERTGEADMFSFTTTGGTVTLNFAPAANHPDLDILATLYNSAGTALVASNPSGLAAAISTSLAAGTYYVSVTGAGAGNPLIDGYSNYASLGSYFISGTIPADANTVATFYKHCSFSTSGYAVGLTTGNYTAAQLEAWGIPDNDVSSVTIESGYEVVLYKEDNFQGDNAGFTTDVNCLSTYTLNDSTSSIRVRSVVNELPVVSITSPSSGTTFPVSDGITFSAAASDTDGAVSVVEFYNGTTKLGEDTSTPFTLAWTGMAPGSYTVTAVATDDRGGQSSATVNVTATDAGATFYQHCTYGGYAVSLPAGSYTRAQMEAAGILNNDLSSLQIYSGYEVLLYKQDNFAGTAYLFSGDYSCLVAASLNDSTSSIVVRAASSAAAEPIAYAAGEESLSPVIAPNPATDYVTIRYGHTDEQFSVTVLTPDGRRSIPAQKVKNGGAINVATLDPGLYLIRILTGKKVITGKVIKY